MPYIILFIIIFIFLGFNILGQWLLHDNLKQPYIAGLTFFYAVSTLIRRSPSISYLIGNVTFGWALIFYALCILLAIWCATAYLMNIIPEKKFRRESYMFILLEFIVFCITAVLRYYKLHFYMKFFFTNILVLGIISVIMAVYYAIKCRDQLVWYNKILLTATFVMIFWFLISILFNLKDIQYVYICGIGIVMYFIVYILVSSIRIYHIINRNNNEIIDRESAIQPKDSEQKIYVMTGSEQKICKIMCEYHIKSSKEISQYIDKSPQAIDKILSRLMSKVGVQTRDDLILYCQSNLQIK